MPSEFLGFCCEVQSHSAKWAEKYPLAEADLDWNMEHLNQAELNLLNSVISEDGVQHSQSVVCDPKKERHLAFWPSELPNSLTA